MELILEHESKLKLSWVPGYTFDGSQYRPPLGCMGPTGPRDKFKPALEITAPLQFFISVKNAEDIELLFKIQEKLIDELADDVLFEIKNPPLKKIRGLLKYQYKNEYKQHTLELNDKKEKINDYILKLQELGCENCHQIYLPKNNIPDEWYDWYTFHDFTQANCNIVCHQDTNIYKFLKRHGLLDKYIPEWYKGYLNR